MAEMKLALTVFLAVSASVTGNANPTNTTDTDNSTVTDNTSQKPGNLLVSQPPKENTTPKAPKAPKLIFCMDGTCTGDEKCINSLKNITCSDGVCTKLAKKVNETHSDYTVTCDATQDNCEKFNAAKANPKPTCCSTSFCNNYSPPKSAALNTSVNYLVFIMLTGFFRKVLHQVANP